MQVHRRPTKASTLLVLALTALSGASALATDLDCGTAGVRYTLYGANGSGTGATEDEAKAQAEGAASPDRCKYCPNTTIYCTEFNYWILPQGTDFQHTPYRNPVSGVWSSFVTVPDGTQVLTACEPC